MYLSFCFNDTATTEIYTLSLHDALPIWHPVDRRRPVRLRPVRALLRPGHPSRRDRSGCAVGADDPDRRALDRRSEEHTSELQSRQYHVCRLLLEKKKQMQARKYDNQTQT